MASSMPLIPRVFFKFIEPVLTTFGALQPILASSMVGSILPPPLSKPHPVTPTEQFLALQYSGLLLLITLTTAIIMFVVTDTRVVRMYVAALAVADFPHWAGIAWVLGREHVWQFDAWPRDLKIMALLPLATFSIKVGYLAGMFGPDRAVGGKRKVR